MDNKKTYVLIAMGVLLILGVFLFGDIAKEKVLEKREEKQGTKDEIKFKKEYESLNDDSKENYVSMKVPSQNKMVYSSKEEVLSLLEKGTGIVYFGFPSCPWCRNAVPVLIESAKEENVDKIYYYNALEDRNTLSLKDGKIETKKEGTDFYKKLLEKLGDKASVYEGLEDESIKRLYFPTVVFVKDGEIQTLHESTVDGQKDPSKALTSKQREELKEIYVKGITSIYGKVCDEKC